MMMRKPLAFQNISMSAILYVSLGIGLVTISACEDDPQIVFVVDSPVQKYYDRFIYEASIRGLDVEYATSQVDATIGDIVEENVIGQCSWSNTHNHAITLDRQYWTYANDMQREFLVFHELGHCVLGSDHRDDTDTNGNCASIMTSGTGGCRVVYTMNNRERLVDELFAN